MLLVRQFVLLSLAKWSIDRVNRGHVVVLHHRQNHSDDMEKVQREHLMVLAVSLYHRIDILL